MNSTGAGAGTACNAASWASDRSENSGAVLSTVRKTLPCSCPVGAAVAALVVGEQRGAGQEPGDERGEGGAVAAACGLQD